METQVEVLGGKRRALARYRDAIADYLGVLEGVDATIGPDGRTDPDAPMAPEVARLLMGAQEDLRREIARQMHDGPAQSLTNIVLQAQISDVAVWVRDLDEPSVAPLLGSLRHLLDSFVEIGLGYLSLDRS